MKRKIIKYITITFVCLLVSIIIEHTIVYFILNNEEKHRVALIKKMTFSSVVIAYIYNGKEDGYDYYSNDNDLFFGKYFFENNNQINLEIGDSVSKVPNELVLKIFKKDENGQYKYIGTSK